MKHLFSRWLLMAALVLGATTVMAQKSVLDENFANGKPAGWETVFDFWKFQDGNANFQALVENGKDTLIAPEVSLAELDNKPSVALTYSNVANNGKLNTLKVLYRAASTDEWAELKTFDAAADQESWKDVLPEGLSKVQIALAGAYLGGAETRVYRLAIENKTEGTEAPANLRTENLTTTSVTLWWNECSSPKFMQYNLKVSTTELDDPDAVVADVLDNVGWMVEEDKRIKDEFYELSELQPNTQYYFYVQYDCGDGDFSPWASANFRTPCESINAPFTENFEGELSGCCTILKNGSVAAVSSEYAYNSQKAFKSVSGKGVYNYFILPEFNGDVKNQQVSFMAAAIDGGDTYTRTVTIGVCTEATDESFTQVKTLSLPKGRVWESIVVSLKGYTGTGKYIAFRVGDANKENRLFIDDIKIEAASECPKPMFVEVSAITPNQAQLSWVETGNADEWNIVLSVKPLADPEDIEPDASKGELAGAVSANPYIVTGLKPDTKYYAYVQAACAKKSDWTNAVEFTTTKEIAYPYHEAFDRMPAEAYTNAVGAMPDGWVVDYRCALASDATNFDKKGTTNYLPYVSTTYNHANSAYVNASLYLRGTSSGTGATKNISSIAMLPAMPKPLSGKQISFWAFGTATCDIKVGVAKTQTADLDQKKQLGANITEVGSVSLSKTNVWRKYAVSLATYTGDGKDGQYIALYLIPGTGTPAVYIDDIVVEDIACGEVTEIVAEATNATTARVAWNDLAATSWKVKVASAPIDPASENGDIANETVNTKEYSATGLSPQTTYYFYVSPACVDKWEVAEATTMKVTGTIIPYYNDFTNETSGYGTSAAPVRGPKDWKLGYTYANTYSYSTTSVPYVITTGWDNAPFGVEKNSLYLYNTTNANTQYPYAIMPEVSNADIKDLTISFYAYTTLTTNLGTAADPNYSQFKIGVVESMNDISKENGFSKVTEIATVKIKASKVAQFFVVDMSSYTGSGKCIVFYNDKVGTAAKACTNYIDNLSITLTSANAPMPISDLAVSDITTSTAKLTWTKNGNETQWEALVFNEAQDDPEDGTPVWSGTVNTTTANVTGLSVSAKKYYAYVRSVQSNGKGAWAYTSFYAACGPMALPFYEDFNGYPTGGTSNNTWYPCYSIAHSDASNWPYVRLYTGASVSHQSKSNILSMEAATGKVSQLEFPEMNAPVNTLQIELEASPYSTSFGAKFITFFGVVTSDGTFHEVAQRTNSAKAWEPWLVDFSSYDYASYGDGKIAIRLDPTKAAAVSGTSATKQYVFIENVKISTIPVCKQIQPDDIQFTEVGPDSMTIAWPNAEASKWNLKVSTSILEDPATATADIFDGTIENTPTKKFTGIEDNTWYYVYVQTVRPDKDCEGDWSRYAKKKTLCFPREFPYEEDFESYNTGAGNLPDCSNICGQDPEHSYVTTKNGSKTLWIQQKATDHKNYYVFPALNSEDVRKLQLSMQVYVGTTTTTKYYYQVGIMTDPNDPSTFVALHTEELLGASTAYDRVYKFDSYVGDEHENYGGYVAITPQNYITSANKTGYTSLYIDNVVIDLISTCVAPNDLVVKSVGTNDATLEWHTDDETAAHRVRIFDNADAKPYSNTFIAEKVVNGTSAELDGLNGNTVYYAYVRKECAADNLSKWSSATKFITDCEAVQALPYIEGFEGRPYANVTDQAVPACWTNQTIQGTGKFFCYYSSSAKKDGDYGLYLYYTVVDEHAGGSDVGTHRSAIVTPAFDVENLNELLVYFDTKAVSTQYKGSIKIEAVADETLNADAIYITTIDDISDKAWKKGFVRIKDYYSSAQPYKRLRFTPTSSTSVYIDNMVFTKDLSVVFPVSDLKLQMLTENSVKFSFEEITPIIKQWQVAYVAAGGDIEDATILTIDQTEYTLTGLEKNTSYDIYVRGDAEGDTWVGPLNATTLQTPVSLPYSTGFEDDADEWNLYNVRTVQGDLWYNYFIMGDATKCEGTGEKALFVTNDGTNWQSWGNHLPDGTTTATSYVWATRNISIPSVGTYKFSIKVKSPVAYSSHGVWAQLIPAGATFKSGTATLISGATRTGTAASNAVADNCYTVMKQQFGTSEWIWYTQSLDIEEAGIYTLAFYWYNTAAGAKKETPAAIDSVLVEEYICTTPKNLELTNREAEEVSFEWFAGKCKNFEYVVSHYKNLGNPAGVDAADKVAAGTISDGPQVTITGLLPSTDYSFYVRTICPDGETDWVEFDFSTPCEPEILPYTETFVELPECWTISGAKATTVKYLSQEMKDNNEEADIWPCLQLSKGGYAILPDLNIPLNKVQIDLALFNSTNLGAVSIGVMDNNWDFSTFKEVMFCQTEIKLGSTNSSGNPYEIEIFNKMFNLYQGTGKTIAFKNMTENTVYVKYVTLTELPDCVRPQQVELTYLSEDAVTVNWIAGQEEAWELKLNDNEPIAVTENPYRISGLDQGTVYKVAVRAICDDEHQSDWSLPATFQTACGVNSLPMEEDFSGLKAANKRAILTCWSNMATDDKIESVFNGIASPYEPAANKYYTYMWIANYLSQFGDSHQLLFFGSTLLNDGPKYRWMITPQYAIEGNATLSFDVRHTDNKNCAAKPEGRFFVAISTDNGATWKKDDATLIEGIDSVYTTKSVSLNKFAGQNIRVAFYMENLGGETTTKGSGLFTLLDNIRMNCTDTYPYADNACQGYDYEGYGFSIKAEDLPLAGEDSTYYRFAANTENGCDSTIALTITTRTASPVETIHASICQGEEYEFGPYKLTESNPEGQPYYISAENIYGCDSTIYLYLTVNPSVISDVVVAIENTQLPYKFDDYYTVPADAPIGETFEEIVKTSEGECSFNKYIVTVSQCVLPFELEDAICESQTSYESNGFSIGAAELPAVGESKPFNRNAKDEAGCDSIITLTLTVLKNDTVDHLPAYEIKHSELPIIVDGIEILSAETPVGDYSIVIPAENDACSYDRYFYSIIEDLDGLIYVTDGLTDVIIYDALGHKVAVAADSSELKALDLPSGVYLIRTTTQNGNAFCGKFIVK